MARIEILTIGDELIEGRLVDTNAGELSAKLVELGFRAAEHRTVGDQMDAMVEALRTAAGRADAVLVSGGLGPTGDDLTAEAAAAAFGLAVERSPEALEHTRRFFSERGRTMAPTNERQADLPAGCTILPNPEGTAVGFRLDVGRCRLYFMPGVPRELRRMADDQVLPDLVGRLEPSPPLVATLKLFGQGESEVAQRLEGLGDGLPAELGLVVQYRATFPEIHVRLVLEGDRRDADAESALRRLADDARLRLGRAVFAVGGPRVDDDFPNVVARTLSGAGLTVALVESASCGAAARFLAATEAGERCLRGSLIAPDPGVLGDRLGLGTVSAEAAAGAVRRRFGADIGVAALGSPEGDEDHRPGGLTAAAIGPGGSRTKELWFPIDRDRFQRLAGYVALGLAARVAGVTT